MAVRRAGRRSPTCCAAPHRPAPHSWDAVPTLVPRALALQPVARSADFSRGLGTRQDSPVVLRAPEHALARHPGGHVDGLVSHAAVPAVAAPQPTAVPRRGLVGRRRRSAAPRGAGGRAGDDGGRRRADLLRRRRVAPGPAGGGALGVCREHAPRRHPSSSPSGGTRAARSTRHRRRRPDRPPRRHRQRGRSRRRRRRSGRRPRRIGTALRTAVGGTVLVRTVVVRRVVVRRVVRRARGGPAVVGAGPPRAVLVHAVRPVPGRPTRCAPGPGRRAHRGPGTSPRRRPGGPRGVHRSTADGPASTVSSSDPVVARTPEPSSRAPGPAHPDAVLRAPVAPSTPGRPVRAGLQPPVHRVTESPSATAGTTPPAVAASPAQAPRRWRGP